MDDPTEVTYLPAGADPVAAGGSVGPLRLYPQPGPAGIPQVVTSYVTVDGGYVFTVPAATPPRRYWATVDVVPAAAEPAETHMLGVVDHPVDAHLVVPTAEVMHRLGLSDADAAVWEQVRGAIADAQADVEAELRRPVLARDVTATQVWTAGGYPLEDWRAWPTLRSYEDTVRVLSWAPRDDGYYDLVVRVGLDGRNDPALAPIRRYVAAHAMSAPDVVRVWRAVQPDAGRVIRSLSTSGQSVTYASTTPIGTEGAAKAGAPGSLPTLASLGRWRRAGVFQRRGEPYPTGGLDAAAPWWAGIGQ